MIRSVILEDSHVIHVWKINVREYQREGQSKMNNPENWQQGEGTQKHNTICVRKHYALALSSIWDVWLHRLISNITPPLFIKVSVQNQESELSCTYVLVASIFPLYLRFLDSHFFDSVIFFAYLFICWLWSCFIGCESRRYKLLYNDRRHSYFGFFAIQILYILCWCWSTWQKNSMTSKKKRVWYLSARNYKLVKLSLIVINHFNVIVVFVVF